MKNIQSFKIFDSDMSENSLLLEDLKEFEYMNSDRFSKIVKSLVGVVCEDLNLDEKYVDIVNDYNIKNYKNDKAFIGTYVNRYNYDTPVIFLKDEEEIKISGLYIRLSVLKHFNSDVETFIVLKIKTYLDDNPGYNVQILEDTNNFEIVTLYDFIKILLETYVEVESKINIQT
jgi:hypothetical protein